MIENRYTTTYDKIKKANDEIHYMTIRRKDKTTGKTIAKKYAEVHERVKAFRKVYPNGSIKTEMVKFEDGLCICKCEITNNDGELIATATASEKLTGDSRKDYINQTSMLENCETSAVGRALGFAGFGVDTAIASAEEIKRVEGKHNPVDDMPIQESQKQWIRDNLTEEEIKKALVKFNHRKLSNFTFAEAEILREFKEEEQMKTAKKESEVF
ncbi:MAG TPA: hypothetical protein IAB27_05405 [Candidatus Coprosoma intestinipullorum]|uniref:Uncharacterized protein n=1 Tax=Candidatus Coprosoma intestinipullorum TaxID=2840752 RepID=A0A9D0ZRP9_9FIRM|nr:hypothetical protein [Candidatus Coprosoma intestinipullorum]